MPRFYLQLRRSISLGLSILLLLPPASPAWAGLVAALPPVAKAPVSNTPSQAWVILVPDFFDHPNSWKQAKEKFLACGVRPDDIIDLTQEKDFKPGQALSAQADLLARVVSRESGSRPGIKPHLIAQGTGGLISRWYLQHYKDLLGRPAPVEDVMAINVPHQGRAWAKALAWLCPYWPLLKPYAAVLADLAPDSRFMHLLKIKEEQGKREVEAGEELLKLSLSALDKAEGDTFRRALQSKLTAIDQTQRLLGRQLGSMLRFSQAVVLDEADRKRLVETNKSLDALAPLERLLELENPDPQMLESVLSGMKPAARHVSPGQPKPTLSLKKLEAALDTPLQKIDALIRQLQDQKPLSLAGAWQTSVSRALKAGQGADAGPLLVKAKKALAKARAGLSGTDPTEKNDLPPWPEIRELQAQAEALDATKARLLAQPAHLPAAQARAFSLSQAAYGVMVLDRMHRKWKLRQGLLDALEYMEEQRQAWIRAGEELLVKQYEDATATNLEKGSAADYQIYQQRYQDYLTARQQYLTLAGLPDAGVRDEELEFYLERLLPAENDVTAAACQGKDAFSQALSSLCAGQAERERLHFCEVAKRKRQKQLSRLEADLRPMQPRPAASTKISPASLSRLKAGPWAPAWQTWLAQEAAFQTRLARTWQKLQSEPRQQQVRQKIANLEQVLVLAQACWDERPRVEADLRDLEAQLASSVDTGEKGHGIPLTSKPTSSAPDLLQLANLRVENYLACDWNDLIGKTAACETDGGPSQRDYGQARRLSLGRERLQQAMERETSGYQIVHAIQARRKLLLERLEQARDYLALRQAEQKLKIAKAAWLRYQAGRQRLNHFTQARQLEALLLDQRQAYINALQSLAREAQASPNVKAAIEAMLKTTQDQMPAGLYESLLPAMQQETDQLQQAFETAWAEVGADIALLSSPKDFVGDPKNDAFGFPLKTYGKDELKDNDSVATERTLDAVARDLDERIENAADRLRINTGVKRTRSEAEWQREFAGRPATPGTAIGAMGGAASQRLDQQSAAVQNAVGSCLAASELKTRLEEVRQAAVSGSLKEAWDVQDIALAKKSTLSAAAFDALSSMEPDVTRVFDNTGGAEKRAMESADFDSHWQKVQEARKLMQTVGEAISADPEARMRARDELMTSAVEAAGRRLESYLTSRSGGVAKDLVKQISPLVHDVVLGGQRLDQWAGNRIKNQWQQLAENQIDRQGNAAVKQGWKLLKGLQQGENIGQEWVQSQTAGIQRKIQSAIQAKLDQVGFYQRKETQAKMDAGLQKVEALSEEATGLLERQNAKMADAVEAWLPYPQEQRVWRHAADMLQDQARQQMLAVVARQTEQLNKVKQDLVARLASQSLEIKQLNMAMLAESIAKKYAELGQYLNGHSSDILNQTASFAWIMHDSELLMNLRQGIFQEVIRANPALAQIERLQDIRGEFNKVVEQGGQEAKDWFQQTQLAKHLDRLNEIREDLKTAVDHAIDQGASQVIQGQLGDLLKRWGVESQYVQVAMDMATGSLKQYLRDSSLYSLVDRYTNIPALLEDQFDALLGSLQSYFAASSLAKDLQGLSSSVMDLWDQLSGKKPLGLAAWSQNLSGQLGAIQDQVKEMSRSVSQLLDSLSNADSSVGIWKSVETGLKQFAEGLGQSVTDYVRQVASQGLGVDFLNLHVGFGSLADLLKNGSFADLFKLGHFGDMLGSLFQGYEFNISPQNVWNQVINIFESADWKADFYEDASGVMRSLYDSVDNTIGNGLQWIGDRWKEVENGYDIIAGGPEAWEQALEQLDWKKNWAALDQFIPDKYKPLKSALDDFILKSPDQWDYVDALQHLSVYLSPDWQKAIHTVSVIYKVYEEFENSDKATFDYRTAILTVLDELSQYLDDDWKAKYAEFKTYEGYADESYKLYSAFQARDWGALISEAVSYAQSMIPAGQGQVYLHGQGLAAKPATANVVPIDMQAFQAGINAALGDLAAKGINLNNPPAGGAGPGTGTGSVKDQDVADYANNNPATTAYQYTVAYSNASAGGGGSGGSAGVADFDRKEYLAEQGLGNGASTGTGNNQAAGSVADGQNAGDANASSKQAGLESEQADGSDDEADDDSQSAKKNLWDRTKDTLDEDAKTVADPRRLIANGDTEDSLAAKVLKKAEDAVADPTEDLGDLALGATKGFTNNKDKDYWIGHTLANKASEKTQEATDALLKKLDDEEANASEDQTGLSKYDKIIKTEALKAGVETGNVLIQGVLDVPKLGEDTPEAWADTKKAYQAWKNGDTQTACLDAGEALGHMGREVSRVAAGYGLGKGLLKAGAGIAGKIAKQAATEEAEETAAASVDKAIVEKTKVKYNPETNQYYDSNTGRALDQVPWPENDGFVPGTEKNSSAEVGKIVDRYGDSNGSFLAPEGTPYENRGIPEGYTEYHKYKIVKSFDWKEGTSSEVKTFGSVGGGTQYQTPQKISQLVKEGYLEEIK